MKRLWVQQTLAFSVVIIVIMSTVAIWINKSAVAEFRRYVTLRDVQGPGSGVEELADYYQRRGSWEGVESLLAEGVYFSSDRMGILLGATSAEIGPEEKEKRPDVLLTDADGRVVFDSDGKVKGEMLSRREIANAWPITKTDDREPIGYLLLFFSVKARGRVGTKISRPCGADAICRYRIGRDLDAGCRRLSEPSSKRALATFGGCGPGCRRWRPGPAGRGRGQHRSRPSKPGF